MSDTLTPEFAAATAAAIGDGWSARPPDQWGGVTLTRETDGAEVRIAFVRGTGCARIVARPEWAMAPAESANPHAREAFCPLRWSESQPEITTATVRGPAALGSAIARRLLPASEPLWLRSREIRDTTLAHRRGTMETRERLITGGFSRPFEWEKPDTQLYGPGGCAARPSADRVYVDRLTVPVEHLDAFLALLAAIEGRS